MEQTDLDTFEGSRGRLAAVAYRLLGSASEAEDAVQEAFIRWQAAERSRVGVPAAWLTKVVTNICLNQLTSARARRETYVGQWLPEPLLDDDPMLGPADTAEQRESVSFAVLRLLEQLSPVERTVYVLREAFAHSHAEIAEILDASEGASQQALSRARRRIADDRPRGVVTTTEARPVVQEFLTAATNGRVDLLVDLLADDAIGVGDGGGQVPARRTPLVGAAAVATFMRGIAKPSDAKRAFVGDRVDMYAASVNGSPAAVVAGADRVAAIMVLDVVDGRIAGVLTQANPDKLERASQRWAARSHGEPLISDW